VGPSQGANDVLGGQKQKRQGNLVGLPSLNGLGRQKRLSRTGTTPKANAPA
jgi:hypothetical protein